jgi:hypothetical protein
MTPKRSPVHVLPGTRPGAPRRNVLVGFAYVLSILVTSGVLRYLVGTIV